MDYLCAKFGDFTFSRFVFITRTDRQTESQRQINAILTQYITVDMTNNVSRYSIQFKNVT